MAYYDNLRSLSDRLVKLGSMVYTIAKNLDIDLDAAIAKKFNKTSEKVGLSVRMK